MASKTRELDVAGRGAMSVVYRAERGGERGTRRMVAVKRLRPELRDSPDAVDLFVREAQLAMRFQHPNIVAALEFDRDEQGYYLVSEWLRCVSLASVVERFGKMPWEVAAIIGSMICNALEHVHSLIDEEDKPLEIVHRDVAPANILVTHDGSAKLTDFGLAMSPRSGEAVEIEGAGTPGFAAPEQLDDAQSVDRRADVYGLGKTLQAISEEGPAMWQEILRKATQEDPQHRYADCNAFGQAIERLAHEHQVAISPGKVRAWLPENAIRVNTMGRSLDGALQSMLGTSAPQPPPVALMTHESSRRATSQVTAAPSRRRIGWIVTAGVALLVLAWLAPRWILPAQVPPPKVKIPPPMLREKIPPVPPPKPEKNGTDEKPRKPLRPVSIPMATVSLNSVPWAELYFGKKFLGNTPLVNIKLPAGRQTIRFVHPPNGLERTFVIELKPKQSHKFLFDLKQGTRKL